MLLRLSSLSSINLSEFKAVLLCVENTEETVLKFFPTKKSSDTNTSEPVFSKHRYCMAFASGCFGVVVVHTQG